MAEGFLLSEHDRDLLRSLLDRERHRQQNVSGRARVEWASHQAPEVYVVKAPAGGIPAMSGSTPGSAECNVYQLLRDATPSLSLVSGLAKAVYNISSSAIAANDWAVVTREKYGAWLVPPRGGATAVSWLNLTTGNFTVTSTYANPVGTGIIPAADTDGFYTSGTGAIATVTAGVYLVQVRAFWRPGADNNLGIIKVHTSGISLGSPSVEYIGGGFTQDGYRTSELNSVGAAGAAASLVVEARTDGSNMANCFFQIMLTKLGVSA